MIEKEFVESRGHLVARLRFSLPSTLWSESVFLVGDFNDWQQDSHPLARDRAGNWFLAIDLQIGRAYQFRYLCDGGQWINDPTADCYVHNTRGFNNFVVVTDPSFRIYLD